MDWIQRPDDGRAVDRTARYRAHVCPGHLAAVGAGSDQWDRFANDSGDWLMSLGADITTVQTRGGSMHICKFTIERTQSSVQFSAYVGDGYAALSCIYSLRVGERTRRACF